MSQAYWVLIAAVAAVLGFVLGRRRAGVPDDARETEEVARLNRRVEELQTQCGTLARERDEIAAAVLRRAVSFMHASVAEPIRESLAQGGEALEGAAREAAEYVEDLEFFTEVVLHDPQPVNVTTIVADLAKEFTADWDLPVRISGPSQPLRARIAAESLKDALYLVLTNAGHFGEGGAVDVILESDGSHHRVLVRDQGAGFSPEALERAMDPFFSTRRGGLGLGLPHARKILEANRGEVRVRNRPEGGGEVEIVLPVD
jgi:signal transduction histidine kinase